MATRDSGAMPGAKLAEWLEAVGETLAEGMDNERLETEIFKTDDIVESPSGEADRVHLFALGAYRTIHEPAAKSSIWSISELLFDQ